MQYGVDKTNMMEYPAAITCPVTVLCAEFCIILSDHLYFSSVWPSFNSSIYLMCMPLFFKPTLIVKLKFKNQYYSWFVRAFIGYKYPVMLLNIGDQNHLKMG